MPTHQLHLHPTDVLFFKDGRPMDGASSGHGAAWPLPHILDAALHAALHRSGETSHQHVPARSSQERDYSDENRNQHGRNFGSLQTAGPFPVDKSGHWLFPRPADAQKPGSAETTLRPLKELPAGATSSLPNSLHPVINTLPPSKDNPEPWLSTAAWQHYLDPSNQLTPSDQSSHFLHDDAIFAAEHTIGIGIDPITDTQDGEHFYSASYLRLQPGWSLGLLAACNDKDSGDLIEKIFPNSGAETHIIAGGQQRTATVLRATPQTLPLPVAPAIQGNLVRWTLLTPAIFPRLEGKHTHPGGWLPTWIDPETKKVQLLDGPGKNAARRRKVPEGKTIPATLIAARVSSPIPVTGWSLGHAADRDFGAKATHLAVPAGSVYYFACTDEKAAQALSAALNWHGTEISNPKSQIVNRRSTLLGEKGYGLGLCSPFQFTSLDQIKKSS
ncbi:MAG: type III-B CRISPR module-associated Cmr3 family protein [Chthoniobacterales bacterium]